MVEDLVISTYKEQIKESLLKAKAIEIAGLSVIVSELDRRGIDTSSLMEFFNKIKNSTTKEELDLITVNELDQVVDSVNAQITKALISPIDISDILIRKSNLIANDMSVDGKVLTDDNFIKIGANLANDINTYGIAHGIDTCLKNYTIQKVYQASYQEKINEKEKELGTYQEETNSVNEKLANPTDTRKNKIMNEIFLKNISNIDESFENIKTNYLNYVSEKAANLNDYK